MIFILTLIPLLDATSVLRCSVDQRIKVNLTKERFNIASVLKNQLSRVSLTEERLFFL